METVYPVLTRRMDCLVLDNESLDSQVDAFFYNFVMVSSTWIPAAEGAASDSLQEQSHGLQVDMIYEWIEHHFLYIKGSKEARLARLESIRVRTLLIR